MKPRRFRYLRALPPLLLLSACGTAGDAVNPVENVRPSEKRPNEPEGAVLEAEVHDISPTVSCGAEGVTIDNFPRYADGNFEGFNLNIMRSDQIWGGMRFPDALEKYRALYDARSNKFAISYAQMKANVDEVNANLPEDVRQKPVPGANGYYVFLSRSDFTHAEDMDNFSSCRSPG